MSKREFLRLMEDNFIILDRMGDRMRMLPAMAGGVYPRQLTSVLVRLHRGGRARLKDIARREGMSTANLCAAFRRLEQDGMVVRSVDTDDRRNMWYDVTDAGAELASAAVARFRGAMADLFAGVSDADVAAMTESLKTMNAILKKLESK